MGRILVVLTFACLIAALVIIHNAKNGAVQSAAVNNSNAAAQGNSRSSKASQNDKRGQGQLSAGVSKTGKKHDSTAASNGTEAAVADAPDRGPVDANGDPLLTVKSDSTPVYSANSKQSRVLRRLRRGDKIRPDVEIIDTEGRWRVVKGREKEKPGFVREEQIERSPADGSSAQTKPVRPTKQL